MDTSPRTEKTHKKSKQRKSAQSENSCLPKHFVTLKICANRTAPSHALKLDVSTFARVQGIATE